MSVQITFLGAAGTVTGSKYLVESGKTRILVDAGMFQGDRRWREENWRDPSIDFSTLTAVLLTHAHIDHTGMLPRFYRQGLRCPIYTTSSSAEITKLVLLDSARLQEEEAQYRLQTGKSRHHPPQPLYRVEEAEKVLQQLQTVTFHKPLDLGNGVSACWSRMGHILGAAAIELKIGGKVINFSGDIGRYTVPILCDPEPITFGDLLLIESTYGDRLHPQGNPAESLGEIIRETEKRGGLVLIPSFAVGRTQNLLYYIRQLKAEKKISDLPVIIDSPMARDATSIYLNAPDDYDAETKALLAREIRPFSAPSTHFIQDRSESIQLNGIDKPMILISASGMLSGGRILHHLKHRLPDPRNTLLFVGHQPEGGRGDWIKKGNSTVTVLGDEIPVRAKIAEISGLSAHADRDEMLRWCRASKGIPGQVFVVHGEPDSARSFSQTLRDQLQWKVSVAEYLQKIEV